MGFSLQQAEVRHPLGEQQQQFVRQLSNCLLLLHFQEVKSPQQSWQETNASYLLQFKIYLKLSGILFKLVEVCIGNNEEELAPSPGTESADLHGGRWQQNS